MFHVEHSQNDVDRINKKRSKHQNVPNVKQPNGKQQNTIKAVDVPITKTDNEE
jgi:hypothetical protein